MWISKRKYQELEKRITALEMKGQEQTLYKKVRKPYSKECEYQEIGEIRTKKRVNTHTIQSTCLLKTKEIPVTPL